MFARGDNGTLFTFATTRDLKLVYFDGCSADKAEGVDDTQDILIWGKLGHDAGRGPGRGEQVRLVDACEWAKEFDVDGFIRMEMDLYVRSSSRGNTDTQDHISEIMYCDFTRGLQLVSALNIINSRPGGPGGPGGPGRPGRKHPPGGGRDGLRRDIHNGSHIDGPPDGPSYGPGGPGGPDGPDGPDGPGRPGGPRGPGRGSPSTPPPGWKGALPNIGNAVEHAGSWHNTFPGDLRVHVDPASMLTFFDPAFTSLIPSRRALPREQYRLHNLSNIDVAQARKDIAEMFSRPAGERSGVDWLALAQTVQDRFAERLPYLRYMLHLPTQNVSAHAAAVRQQFIVSLIPYMPRAGVGEPAWFAETAQGCRASYTAHLPIWRFTKQEHVLHNAVDEVLHEVCRVLTSAWSEAFGVEDKSIDAAAELLTKWKDEVDALVGWLDWPVWMRCENSCAINVSLPYVALRYPLTLCLGVLLDTPAPLWA